MKILTGLTTNYLKLTNEEIENWKIDPLNFYLDQLEESNEVKGNFLREKAMRVIAGIQLHLEPHFDKFCNLALPDLKKEPADPNQPLENQRFKDSLM